MYVNRIYHLRQSLFLRHQQLNARLGTDQGASGLTTSLVTTTVSGLVLPHPLPHPLFRLPFARFVNVHPFETLILIVWEILRPLDSFFVIRGLANGKCNIRLNQRSSNR